MIQVVKNPSRKPSFAKVADVAVIGAGPYGLSIAAYLRDAGFDVRSFGRPMSTWREHMPKGMFLKSEGFASDLYAPGDEFTLADFCRDAGIAYADVGVPVALATFSDYGEAFQRRYVPNLDPRDVVRVTRYDGGFEIVLEDGAGVRTRRVVVATGISHFAYVPPVLADLPPEYCAHSATHSDYASFRGKRVAVIGAGASAVDVAIALHDAGAHPELIARTARLAFHDPPRLQRSFFSRLRYPRSGLGCGLKSRFFTDFPDVFSKLPPGFRSFVVRTQLGPAPGWPTKEPFSLNVPAQLGNELERCEVRDGHVALRIVARSGKRRELIFDHVIAATGYRVSLEKLPFLDDSLRASIAVSAGSPALNRDFESSVPGLFFVGLPAAETFGPLLRFAYGARFAAQRLRATLVRQERRVRR